MDPWIDHAEFNRIQLEEPRSIRIEGGFDSFERVDIRDSNEGEEDIHVFKVEKTTEIFEISIYWAVQAEDDDISDEVFKERARNRLRTESSYQSSHYLKSMDLPPLQGLFAEGMTVEMVTEPEDIDDS